MALTRSMLKGMGLDEEQIGAIIDAHIETVDGLKEERDGYKVNSEKLREVTAELNKLKADGGDWQSKYDELQAEYEKFKAEQANKETARAVKEAYTALLKEAGVSEKRLESVLKVTNLKDVALTKEGKIKDADKLTESIKTEWADFITTEETKGTDTPKPPKSDGGGTGKTRDEILAIKDGTARRSEMMANSHLFPELGSE